jgi:hypothetical protein
MRPGSRGVFMIVILSATLFAQTSTSDTKKKHSIAPPAASKEDIQELQRYQFDVIYKF